MFPRLQLTSLLLWTVALVALALLARGNDPPVGWDELAYREALHALARGHDPYQNSLEAEARFLASSAAADPAQHEVPCVSPPCPYVYAPVTLPWLSALSRLPRHIVFPLFLLLYTAAAVAVPLSLLFLALPGEERTLAHLLAPGTLFFPGLVLDFVIFSGNVAYILYGLALPAAVLGWRRGRWLPFYFAVLLASCFKPPMLTLLALPLFSSGAAWRGVLWAVIAGITLFGVQAWIWPARFHPFLQVLDMLFRQDADFGVSPAGLLGRLLHRWHHAYTSWTTIAFLVYAPWVVWVLWRGRQRRLNGTVTAQQWLPTLLLGTLLLNPRIKEYDVAAITMPMLLLTWRLVGQDRSRRLAIALFGLVLALLGLLVTLTTMQVTYGLLLVTLFVGGSWQALRKLHPSITAS